MICQTRVGQREIDLRHQPDPRFDRIPVVVERVDDPLTHLSLYPDVAKAGRPEEALQPPCVCQREREVERFALIGKIATQRVGENAPHRCPLRCGDDTYCGIPAQTEDPPELHAPSRRVREELQTELAHDGVKTAVPKRQRLAVRGHGPKRCTLQPGARSRGA